MKQNLLTKAHFQQLVTNGLASVPQEKDHKPVVFLFSSHGPACWLLSELLPEDHDISFGLFDPGDGSVVSGYLSLTDLEGLRDCHGLGVERDITFTSMQPLSAYYYLAKSNKFGLRDCLKILTNDFGSATVIDHPVPRPRRDMTTAQLAVDARLLGLGRLHIADGAAHALKEVGVDVRTLLKRHAADDWGDINQEDWKLNDEAKLEGGRTYSTYILNPNVTIWAITEADRSATGIFLPNEYC